MSGGLFSYALAAALATALLVAAFTDLRRREIDNGLNLTIALAAPLWWLANGYGLTDVGFQLALAAITFVVACLLFAMRQMGGGDVKLLTALALWLAPVSFTQMIVLTAVIGGGASVVMATLNMKRVPGEVLRNALALTAALLWMAAVCAILFSLMMHRPLVGGATVARIATLLSQPWVLALAVAAVALVLALGFAQIVRRQKSRLPVPYGIAIAAAGLWVLGERTVAAVHPGMLPG